MNTSEIIAIIALGISLISLLWNIYNEYHKRKPKLEITFSESIGLINDIDFEILFKNMSNRPTAITDFKLRENSFTVIDILSIHKSKTRFPVKIDPWSTATISFKYDEKLFRKVKDIYIEDIDNNVYTIDLITEKRAKITRGNVTKFKKYIPQKEKKWEILDKLFIDDWYKRQKNE